MWAPLPWGVTSLLRRAPLRRLQLPLPFCLATRALCLCARRPHGLRLREKRASVCVTPKHFKSSPKCEAQQSYIPRVITVCVCVCVCVCVPRYRCQSCSTCEVQRAHVLPLLQTMSSVFGPAGGSLWSARPGAVTNSVRHAEAWHIQEASLAP